MASVDVTKLNNREKMIYDNAGGGELGEKAVLNYREYIDGYRQREREYARYTRRNLYTAKNEKRTATVCCVEDDYD